MMSNCFDNFIGASPTLTGFILDTMALTEVATVSRRVAGHSDGSTFMAGEGVIGEPSAFAASSILSAETIGLTDKSAPSQGVIGKPSAFAASNFSLAATIASLDKSAPSQPAH